MLNFQYFLYLRDIALEVNELKAPVPFDCDIPILNIGSVLVNAGIEVVSVDAEVTGEGEGAGAEAGAGLRELRLLLRLRLLLLLRRVWRGFVGFRGIGAVHHCLNSIHRFSLIRIELAFDSTRA